MRVWVADASARAASLSKASRDTRASWSFQSRSTGTRWRVDRPTRRTPVAQSESESAITVPAEATAAPRALRRVRNGSITRPAHPSAAELRDTSRDGRGEGSGTRTRSQRGTQPSLAVARNADRQHELGHCALRRRSPRVPARRPGASLACPACPRPPQRLASLCRVSACGHSSLCRRNRGWGRLGAGPPVPALTGSPCAVVQAVCGALPAKAAGSAARAVSGRKAVAGAALKVAAPVRARLQGRPLVAGPGFWLTRPHRSVPPPADASSPPPRWARAWRSSSSRCVALRECRRRGGGRVSW